METKILIDTNVLLDYLLTREPFYEDAMRIIHLCKDEDIKACIAAHSIPNMFFILRKDYSVDERRKLLISICTIFDVEGIDRDKLVSGLKNEDFSDFEDCLQMECAKAYGADYIVTRNTEDFSTSDVPAITPGEFSRKFSK
jgi:predicted nucleic acid-binding protein